MVNIVLGLVCVVGCLFTGQCALTSAMRFVRGQGRIVNAVVTAVFGVVAVALGITALTMLGVL